jgi:hypothetical protein
MASGIDTIDEASSMTRHQQILIAAGAGAGLFSALFGVGGGVIIVPILVLAGGYAQKRASSVSLAAIIFIALWGTIAQGALGNVEWRAALLVGIPAMAGVAFGIHLKHRLNTVAMQYGFAGLLVVIAIVMVVK